MIVWIVTSIMPAGLLIAAGQPPVYRAPRTVDGKPDMNGIWQSLNTANWDIQGHAARASQVVALGAAGAVPAGMGVVEGNEIPYLPAAAAKRQENFENRLTADPENKCFLPGVPRATYMPFPFQIVQTPKHILIAYEFASASRIIYMGNAPESPVDTWMGHSVGHWKGKPLSSTCRALTTRPGSTGPEISIAMNYTWYHATLLSAGTPSLMK